RLCDIETLSRASQELRGEGKGCVPWRVVVAFSLRLSPFLENELRRSRMFWMRSGSGFWSVVQKLCPFHNVNM
ncbi:hypothetical protein JMJ77_0013419, partial [Colletotrichum scovillei]